MSRFVNFSDMKDRVIRIRISSAAFSSISSLASLTGVSVSEYIRLCISFAKKNKKDFQKYLNKNKK